MLALLVASALAVGPEVSWEVGTLRRYLSQTEVWVERRLAVPAGRTTARAEAWRARVVLACNGDRDASDLTIVRCHVEDAAVDVAADGADSAAVAADLIDAVALLRHAADGSIASVSVSRHERRVGSATRAILTSAVAGLDYSALPGPGDAEPTWTQPASCLLATPSVVAVAGGVTHRVVACADVPEPVSVLSEQCDRRPSARAGRGVVLCKLRAWIDDEALVVRRWAVVALDDRDASRVASAQFGRIELLDEKEAAGVGESGRMDSPERSWDVVIPRLDRAGAPLDARCP